MHSATKIHHIEVDGTRIAVYESPGAGPPALLVHWNSSSAAMYAHQLDGPLGRRHRLVAVDLPGHGRSDNAADPAATYSLPGLARVVVGVARELHIQDAMLVGGSLGGHVVLEAIEHLPGSAGLCLFGCPPLAFPPALDLAYLPNPALPLLFKGVLNADEQETWLQTVIESDSDGIASFRADLLRVDPRFRPGLLESVTAVGFADEVEVVRRLKQPLAVIHGQRDRIANLDYIRSLALPSLWRGEIQLIADAAHGPQWECPDAFDKLLAAFLTETAPT